MVENRIYADHAATTQLLPCARAEMTSLSLAEFGNPSSLYARARKPRRALAEARARIAAAIGPCQRRFSLLQGDRRVTIGRSRDVRFTMQPRQMGALLLLQCHQLNIMRYFIR